MDKLEQEKRAIEEQLIADYGNTKFATKVRDEKGNVKDSEMPFDMAKLLTGEMPIPQVPDLKYDPLTKGYVEVGKKNDPRAEKWLGLIAKHETAMKQAKIPFTPAKELAKQGSPKKQVSGLSDEDKQAIEWARSHPNDPRATKILNLHKLN